MQKNKYKYLNYILIEEKRLESLAVKDSPTKLRLAEIGEIKAAFYSCEIEAIHEFLKDKPNTKIIAEKFAEYYKLQSDKTKQKIRNRLKILCEEYQVEVLKRKMKKEKEEDEFFKFILWCILSRDSSLIYMISDDMLLVSVMTMIAVDNNNNNPLRIKI